MIVYDGCSFLALLRNLTFFLLELFDMIQCMTHFVLKVKRLRRRKVNIDHCRLE